MQCGSKRRFVELDNGYDTQPVQVVGLSNRNLTGEIISRPTILISKFLTTRVGMEYNETSRTVYEKLPLHGDLQNPVTFVSIM